MYINSMPVSGTPTFNVGEHVTVSLSPCPPSTPWRSWTISGPTNIKDYNDDLGTTAQNVAGAPLPWSTTPLAGADMSQTSLSFYWAPSANQIHPANAPETRTISVAYQGSQGVCLESATVTIERNATNPARQAEDFYTANHQGRVVAEYAHWRSTNMANAHPAGHWTNDLAWQGYFLARFDSWRQTFGYSPIAPWYSGRPLPTGPSYDHPNRPSYNPSQNRIPWSLTLAGTPPNWPNSPKLADFASLQALTTPLTAYANSVECALGVPNGGGTCSNNAPKDPMFWRWRAFVHRVYGNYCTFNGQFCHFTPAPASDPWMGDTQADIQAGGVPPSPGPHWMTPDVWNRTTEQNGPACLPGVIPAAVNTVGGVTRACGSDADHENPIAGQTNYLYATIRNTGTSPQRNLYAEVAVYIGEASTGLAWPADFTLLPDSRQFIALNLDPNQVTAIGPLPWTPPFPINSDHYCLYVRILSVQETPPVEGVWAGNNAMNSNSISTRNLKIIDQAQNGAMFIVRNINDRQDQLSLEIALPPALLAAGPIVLRLDPALQRASRAKRLEGARALGDGRFALLQPKVTLSGLRLAPRGQGVAEIKVERAGDSPPGDIVVTQRSTAGVDGGVTLRVRGRREGTAVSR
jgi:hypothetical protein